MEVDWEDRGGEGRAWGMKPPPPLPSAVCEVLGDVEAMSRVIQDDR